MFGLAPPSPSINPISRHRAGVLASVGQKPRGQEPHEQKPRRKKAHG